jgi:hypothetical protein
MYLFSFSYPSLKETALFWKQRDFPEPGQDQKIGDERYEGSSKKDNTMDKERKHGTAMDFSEIVRCIK